MAPSPQLLAQLRAVGFEVAQHKHSPQPDEWFAGLVIGELGGGDMGPYESADEALVHGIGWLVRLLRETQDERDEAWKALRAAQAELRAEREAKGGDQ